MTDISKAVLSYLLIFQIILRYVTLGIGQSARLITNAPGKLWCIVALDKKCIYNSATPFSFKLHWNNPKLTVRLREKGNSTYRAEFVHCITAWSIIRMAQRYKSGRGFVHLRHSIL